MVTLRCVWLKCEGKTSRCTGPRTGLRLEVPGGDSPPPLGRSEQEGGAKSTAIIKCYSKLCCGNLTPGAGIRQEERQKAECQAGGWQLAEG